MRVKKELRAYLGVRTLEVREIRINIPDNRETQGLPMRTPPVFWERTKWACSRYEEVPNTEQIPRINSPYTCHAEEINRFTLFNENTYTFANTSSWLDVGLQILPYNRWAPECSRSCKIDPEKVLPPREGRKYISPGFAFDDEEPGPRQKDAQGRFKKTPIVYAGMATLGDIGTTARIIKLDNIATHRGLHIHGAVIAREKPAYLQEVAAVHAMRALHDWLRQTDYCQEDLNSMAIKAGSYQMVGAISNWFEAGTLTLQSEAASVMAGGFLQANNRLKICLKVRPLVPPEYVVNLAELPAIHLQLLTMFEEFRRIALPTLGATWSSTLPRIPLAKEELKEMVRAKWEADEILALRQLSQLDSVSARIITDLELARRIVRMAMSVLREGRGAQVTLLSILGATRFKTFFRGVLVLTRCPHAWGRVACGFENSYGHLLE